MEGIHVFICQFLQAHSCVPCGVARDTKGGEWDTVHCTGGWIEGNQLKIVHSYKPLQFCEIKAYGKELGWDHPGAIQRLTPTYGTLRSNTSAIESEFVVPLHFSQPQVGLTPSGHLKELDCFDFLGEYAFYLPLASDVDPNQIVTLHYVQFVNCPKPECAHLEGLKFCAVTEATYDLNTTIQTCKKVGKAPPGERVTVEFENKPVIEGLYFPQQLEYDGFKLCRVEFFVT